MVNAVVPFRCLTYGVHSHNEYRIPWPASSPKVLFISGLDRPTSTIASKDISKCNRIRVPTYRIRRVTPTASTSNLLSFANYPNLHFYKN
ncbi:hypothetical protein NPIL_168271 [Nephila pilipes]|uniref:Uncharacterized protein n=1 Tax=Nephila pilipes TaxID=299642 RepID=A0A8X6NPY2_NEPPI|nr:hypothetical protein NPIL_168271 [Nephila pilipes]